jgi:hypothetical protein
MLTDGKWKKPTDSVSADHQIGKLDRTVDEYEHFAHENAKDIVAVGFDPKKLSSSPTTGSWAVTSTETSPESPRFEQAGLSVHVRDVLVRTQRSGFIGARRMLASDLIRLLASAR